MFCLASGRGGVLIISPFLLLIQPKTPGHEVVLTHIEYVFLPQLS